MKKGKNPGGKEDKMATEQFVEQQNRLAEYGYRKAIERDMAIDKEWKMNDAKMSLAYRKIELQEWRKEKQKARYESVAISENGEIQRTVHNAIVEVPDYKCVNFQFIQLSTMVSTDGDRGLYQLQIQIGKKLKRIILYEKKMGNPTYFFRKLTEAGSVILITKKRERENLMIHLWSLLLSLCESEYIVPTHVGWVAFQGKFRFVEEEEILWKDLSEQAK